jgi:hypothetical protein
MNGQTAFSPCLFHGVEHFLLIPPTVDCSIQGVLPHFHCTCIALAVRQLESTVVQYIDIGVNEVPGYLCGDPYVCDIGRSDKHSTVNLDTHFCKGTCLTYTTPTDDAFNASMMAAAFM